MTKTAKWISGILAGTVALIVLTAYFGGPMIERILDSRLFRSSDAPLVDRTAVTSAPAPADTAPSVATADTGMIIRHGPFVIGGVAYTIEVLRDTGSEKPAEAARRVTVFDAGGRRVYEENLFERRDSTSKDDWIEFYPTVLEDEQGRALAFQFGYAWLPSAPGSGVAFNVVGPRGDSLAVLTPGVVGYYGNEGDLPAGIQPHSRRLLPGNRLMIESGRGWFTAMIPLQIDPGCAPRSLACVRFAMSDSIGGLARFAVRTPARTPVDTAIVVDLYTAPRADAPTKATIPVGGVVEILGGAGRVFFSRESGLYVSGEEDWLQIRVNGRTGWINGPESFGAIGLRQIG